MSPGELIAKLESINVEALVFGIIDDESFNEEALFTQRDQWEQGLNAAGNPIGEYRNQFYAEAKAEMNPRAGGKVDLKLTGAFYNSLKIVRSGEELLFTDDDFKSNELEQKYTDKIFGFAPQSRSHITDLVFERFKHSFTDKTGLEFV
jgi:hypothetical protein